MGKFLNNKFNDLVWYLWVWGNHKLEEFYLLISNHPTQTNIHTRQTDFHDGGTG